MARTRVRLLPLTNIGRRLIGGQRDVRDLARAVEEIAPAEVEPVPPAIYLPGAEKHFFGAHPWTTVETELSVLDTTAHHGPVRRYEFHDVLAHPAGFDSPGGGRHRIRRGQGVAAGSGRIARIHTACYCMSRASDTYFGHWLRDACPTALLARAGEAQIIHAQPDWTHAPAYLEAFSLNPESSPVVHVEKLSLFEDHAQGSSKRQRYASLRKLVRAAFPSRDDGPRAVYFRRGASGARRTIANEEALIARLSDVGFTVVDVMGQSLADLAYNLRSARLVVTIEGSHVNHLYFLLPDAARLLVLIPADKLAMVHLGICRALRFRFGFSVLSPVEDEYGADIDGVLETLELLEQAQTV